MATDSEYREKERQRHLQKTREKRSDPVYRAQDIARTAAYLRKRRIIDSDFRERDNARRSKEYRRSRDESACQLLAMLNRGELATMGDPCFVYLFHNGFDALLYVGITNDPARRLYQHARDKDWFENISIAKLAPFRSETEAMSAEAFLIKSLKPLHNIQHNGSCFTQLDDTMLTTLLSWFVSVDLTVIASTKTLTTNPHGYNAEAIE